MKHLNIWKIYLKPSILFFILNATVINIYSQNVGIGTTEPWENFQVNGNFLVQQPYTYTNSAPTAAQTKILINGITINFATTDSTGRLYETGGPLGNYFPNHDASVTLNCCNDGDLGYEINIEDIDLGSFDSLIISTGSSILYNVGNGYSSTDKITINNGNPTIRFKSNFDASTGRGFSILFKRIYSVVNAPILNQGFGNYFRFDALNGSLRTGKSPVGQVQMGQFSVAMGERTESSGLCSFAMGQGTKAQGNFSIALGIGSKAGSVASTAIGYNSDAAGSFSTAFGNYAHATGQYSTAFGTTTHATGENSTAFGQETIASGDLSVAAGHLVEAAQEGTFFFGDADPDNEGMTSNGATNEFVCRFKNGYFFMTSGGNNNDGTPRTGVRVLPNGNSWSAISDVRIKENFETVDGEIILSKIRKMPQYTWNYKGQNPSTQRHYGPMAQDFFNAFGKDRHGTIGCDTLINQQDFLGVNFIAIQALLKRTDELQIENNKLMKRVELLERKLSEPLLSKKKSPFF